MPFINNTHKFVFIGNARCGSTTMYTKLSNIFANDDIVWEDGRDAKPWLYHMGIKDTIERYPFTKDYKKFCFVRNPWSRMLSSYNEFTGRPEWTNRFCSSKSNNYVAVLEEKLALADLNFYDALALANHYGYDSENIIDYLDHLVTDVDNVRSRLLLLIKDHKVSAHSDWHGNIAKYENFNDFCKDFLNNPLKNDIHFLPMYDQMSIDGEMVMDYVGRFENMAEDFNAILYEITGNNYTLDIHLNNTASSDYAQHYCKQSKEMIEDFYSTDILLLDYRF